MNTQIEDFARHYMWKRLLFNSVNDKAARQAYARVYAPKPDETDYARAYKRSKMFAGSAITERQEKRIDEEMMSGTIGTISGMNIVCTNYDDNCNISLETCKQAVPCAPAQTAKKKPPVHKENPFIEGTMSWREYIDNSMSHIKQKQEVENTMEAYNYSEAAMQRTHLTRRLDTIVREKTGALKDTFHMHPVSLKTRKDVEEAMKNGQVVVNPSIKDEDMTWGFCTSYLVITDPKRDEAGFKAAEKLLGKAYTEAKDKITVLPVEKGLEALNSFEAATFQ